ncbi:MAG: YhfZ family protein [Christensenellales bacterium]|jgi:hypothetical protein
MNFGAYKKLNLITTYLAREFYSLPVPARINTIVAYCEKFDVSRGVIQDALALLQSGGCIKLRARGMKGTYLSEKDPKKLYEYTLWNVITGTMPVPLIIPHQAMATAVCTVMGDSPVPFSFAFVTGAKRRMEMLRNQLYDFSIMSALSAAYFVEKHPELMVAMNLAPCIYATSPYYLLIRGRGQTQLQDGMRVLYDPYCYDQTYLTRRLIQGRKIEMVVEPYVGQQEKFLSGSADALVFRKELWAEDADDISVVDIGEQPGSNVPVMLVNRNNYCIEQLLAQLFVPSVMAQIQRSVMEDPSKVRFY